MGKSLFLEGADPHWALVCLIGIAVVFVGLAVIIGLVELMNLVTTKLEGKKKVVAPKAQSPASPAPVAVGAAIENRDEIVAAVCAAVAEENGTDISAIRVVSFKKV
ncbi:MAG: hypothetical protein E7596_00240 [Ruminococcaceae bacterium]|nr:hypothetical protein [Oscillospiraceae bacterium]